MDTPLALPLEIAIEPSARDDAAKFAAEQVSVRKGKQVYLNTLAIYAVRTYLNWLSIPTDLGLGDSWNSELRSVFDVADLVIPDAGRLECRPVLPGDTELELPIPAGDRLGYVAVEMSEDLNSAKLLGFVPASDVTDGAEALSVADLYPLENLLNTLNPVCG